MNNKLRSLFWPGLLILCLLAVLAAAAFLPLVWPNAGSARASSSAVSLTLGQNAAIQGADQLLLLSPGTNWTYLPVVRR